MVHVFRIDARDGDAEYWATNDLGMDALVRRQYAELGFAIENYHRDLKQFCGVEKCQVRSAQAQRNHIGMAVRAFLRLEWHFFTTGISAFEAKMRVVRDAVRSYLAAHHHTAKTGKCVTPIRNWEFEIRDLESGIRNPRSGIRNPKSKISEGRKRRHFMKYNRFEELPVWNSARELAIRIFGLTATGVLKNYAGLRDQLERAGLSVSNNIAEGFDRGTNAELLTFLYIARLLGGNTFNAPYFESPDQLEHPRIRNL